MREVSPKELQKLNDKSFKNIQKIFRRRLREIAAKGNKDAIFDIDEYTCEKKIVEWLTRLGFKLSKSLCRYTITWPEEEDAGEWIFDPHSYDYVCSECGKHSEYTSPYCPNCGKKLKPLEGRKYDS